MATFSNSYIVCKCNLVSLGEIVYAIKEKKASTIEDIKKFTDAGSSCGCCISKELDLNEKKMDLYIVQILNKFNKEV